MKLESSKTKTPKGATAPGTKSTCKICKGIGFVYEKTSLTGRTGKAHICSHIEEICLCKGEAPFEIYSEKLGGMVACPCKEARMKLHNIERRYEDSAIPPKYQWKFLSDFDMQWLKDDESSIQLFMLVDWANVFIENYGKPDAQSRGMFLFGPPGVGKTLICCIILNEIMSRYDADCRYAKISRDFLGAIQASYSKADDSYGQGSNILRRLQKAEVLVLDDFGTHKDSQWTDGILYDLIDSRYENNRLTLFTSNKKEEEIKNIAGGRIYSRLQEMTTFHTLNIPDYRAVMRKGT